jgi:hypothetical protein
VTAHLSEREWDQIAKGFKVGQVAPARKGRRRSKYNARAVIVTPTGMVHAEPLAGDGDIKGIRFDSRREGLHYVNLLGLVARGAIRDLELQPEFPIHAADRTTRVGVYRADFRYVDVATRRVVVEDVKGVRTPVYRLKKKLVEAEHGITITEVQ